MNYVSRIRFGLKSFKTINTRQLTSQVLDGSYKSIYKGRSMNFEELREYVIGDEIKDIDWKASSRSQKMLVRQYIAEKKHNIMLVMDTNYRMLADTTEAKEKRDVAAMAAGTLAYMVNSDGDYVSAIYATDKSVDSMPFKTGLLNIENILTRYSKLVTETNKSDLERPLNFLIKNMNRRMILVIVSDLKGIYDLSEQTLKRLLLMHDVLMINVSDTDMTGKNVFSVEKNRYLPSFFSEDKRLEKIQKKKQQEMQDAAINKLKKYGVSMITVDDVDGLDVKIVELLQKHKSEKR